jgi:hypothetical protein
MLTKPDVTDLSKSLNSSIVVGKTHVTGPLLAELASSTENLLDNLNRMLRAVLAFLIITLIGSILSTIASAYLLQHTVVWTSLRLRLCCGHFTLGGFCAYGNHGQFQQYCWDTN